MLGPPNEIQTDFSTTQYSSSSIFHGPKEIWNYWGLPNPKLPYYLEFVFIDRMGTGNYVLENSLRFSEEGSQYIDMDSLGYYFNYIEDVAEAMKSPHEYLDKAKGIVHTEVSYNMIPFYYDLFFFKGSEGQIYCPVVVNIPYSSLPSKKLGQEEDYFYSLTLIINMSDKAGSIISEKSKAINFKLTPDEANLLKNRSVQLKTSLSLSQESEKIHIYILDNFSGKMGIREKKIVPADFLGGGLSLSDIILSSGKITEGKEVLKIKEKIFSKFTSEFRPKEELNIYFEIYGLSLNPDTGKHNFQVEYAFLEKEKLLASVVPSLERKPTRKQHCCIQASFKLKNFKPGEYTLQVKVLDKNSGRLQTKKVLFNIIQ